MITRSAAWVLCLLAAGCGSPREPAIPPPPDMPPPQPEMEMEATPPPETPPAATSPTFEDDVAFLRRYGDVQLLTAPSGARVAVSARYQGRVMTSAVAEGGRSLGWVQRSFIEAGKTGTQFDNYGGEDRFWLGPEGGQFGLYFPKGKPFEFSAWQTPAAFQEGAWTVRDQSDSAISFQRAMTVANHSGTSFSLDVTRGIRLLGADDLSKHLGTTIPDGVRWVAFESDNQITNTGKVPWTDKTGLVSIWILSMYPPTPDTHVVLPFRTEATGPIVNDAYFGKVPSDRLVVHERDGYLVFTCDGQHRSKIGLGPSRAMPLLASYSPSAGLLTIVQYDPPKGPAKYVNSMWEQQKDPFAGDVVNSYNDGPTEPGKPPLGGFYEIETSSPGAALRPGQTLAHVQRTFHFMGSEQALAGVLDAVMHLKLADIR
jgi:hypothetical protein